MVQRFVVMEAFLASRRTVVGRNCLLHMSTLSFGSVKISKTSHTVGLLILYAIMLGLRYPTISTTYLVCLPFPFFPKSELRIILPLILSRVSHHVLMGKDCKLLLTWAHVNPIELRLIREEVLG